MTSFPLSSLQQVVYVSVLNAVQLTKTPSDTVHGFVPVCVTMTSKLIFKLRHWIFRCGHVCIFLFIVDKSYLVRNYMHVNKHAIWSKKCVGCLWEKVSSCRFVLFEIFLCLFQTETLRSVRQLLWLNHSAAGVVVAFKQYRQNKTTHELGSICWNDTFYNAFLLLWSWIVLVLV